MEEMIPAVFGLFFAVAFICSIAYVRKNLGSTKEQSDKQNEKPDNVYVDGNGRTPEQNAYLQKLQRQRAENLAKQQSVSIANSSVDDVFEVESIDDYDDHQHLGEAEHYEKIVGSLGEVSDEGCDELDGVRLVSHDDAYEITSADNGDLLKYAKAMVLGDVLNNPRYKKPYSRK